MDTLQRFDVRLKVDIYPNPCLGSGAEYVLDVKIMTRSNKAIMGL